MQNEAKLKSLEGRLKTVLDRLTFFPDEEFLGKFPFGQQLVREAAEIGGIDTIFDRIGRNYFESISVPIPSPEQRLAAAEIAMAGAEGRKRFEFSEPGTRKTLGVLSAIPLINDMYMPMDGHEKVKTLVCCPTYIMPTWIREAERLLHDPNLVVVTRTNRTYAVKRAADPDVDIVLLGYELSHRRTGIDLNDPEVMEEMNRHHIDLLSTVLTAEDGLRKLERLMKPEQFAKYRRRPRTVDQIIERIVLEQKTAEAASITTALQSHAFSNGRPYYAIYDEIHNIIDPNSATGMALSELFLSARWGALVTGTGIRNKLSNLAFLAYLDGRIEDPKDFVPVFRNNPKIMRGLLDLDANPIRTLADIDPDVLEPECRRTLYSRTSDEIDIAVAIANSEIFEGKDQYLLLNYLYTNPRKLLPENFRDTNSPHSLRRKVEQFFGENPDFIERIHIMKPSKLEAVKTRVLDDKETEGRKVVVACEFSSGLTDFLEEKLGTYGAVRIDQTVPAQLGEISLRREEIARLEEAGLYDPRQRFRSHLSSKARSLLGVKHYQIFNPSERQLALLEFQTNPGKRVLVATYGTLREGTDVQEASVLVEYEATTVPYKFRQMLARTVRSGQREKVLVHQMAAAGSLEERKYLFREWKDHLIQKVFRGVDATPEELGQFLSDVPAEKSDQIGSMLKMNARAVIALMFNSLRGRGVHNFVDEMNAYDNAMFLAKNYNYEWAYSFSSNCARLIRDVVHGLEKKNEQALESIVDEGCGPATVSRILERPATCIDLNRFMLEYGMDACEDIGIEGSRYFLGSYTNLGRLSPLTVDDHVFDPRREYEKTEGIKDKSTDLAVCSLALDFAIEDERKDFFSENKRILKYGGYLLLVMPTTKMEQTCKEQFLKDMEDAGFQVDRQLTGTYKSSQTLNIDTGEQQRNGFQTYVIVARKISSGKIVYEEGRDYFRMVNDFRIIEGASNKSFEEKLEERKMRRYECSGFYNSDNHVDPSKLTPADAVPLPKEVNEFADAVDSAEQDDLRTLADTINGLMKDD